MANKNRQKAQKMASRGASVQDIKAKTGLSGQAARTVSRNHNPARTSTTAPQSPPPSSSPSSSEAISSPKATGFRAAMADGKIGRKEIQAHIEAKGIKGKQQGNAQMRIADRWLSKGGALGHGVLKDYKSNYESKNPVSAMAMKMGVNPYGVFDAKTPDKPRHDLYKAANSMLTDKGYAQGDVFSRLKNGDLRALPPMPTNYVPPVSNPVTAQDPVSAGTGTGGESSGVTSPTPTPPTTTPPVDTTPGFGIGGVGDGGTKNALTFRQNKSRWKNSGRSSKGTKNLRFNRSSGFGGFSAAAF